MSYKGKKKKIIDTPHKNKYSPMNIGPSLNLALEDKTILSNMGKGDIVFGSHAFNKQVKFPFPYKKTPRGDIDLKSKKPLFTALKIERGLDKFANQNNYHIEVLEHDSGKTFRVKSKSRNTVVADVGKLEKKIPTKLIDGVLFETIPARKKAVKQLLKNPDAQYRRKKDANMMGYINRYQNQILNRDTDGDGVIDSKDCEPYNSHKQGLVHDRIKARLLSRKINKDNFKNDTEKEDAIEQLMSLQNSIQEQTDTRKQAIQENRGIIQEREQTMGIKNTGGVQNYKENLQKTGKQIGGNFNKIAKRTGKRTPNFMNQTRQPRYLNEAPKFRHGVYEDLKRKALDRKERILRENREDRHLPLYKPPTACRTFTPPTEGITFTPPTAGRSFTPPKTYSNYQRYQPFRPHQAQLPHYLEQKRQAEKIRKVIEHLIKIGRQDLIPEFQTYINQGGKI